jgi:hypothetical protein
MDVRNALKDTREVTIEDQIRGELPLAQMLGG